MREDVPVKLRRVDVDPEVWIELLRVAVKVPGIVATVNRAVVVQEVHVPGLDEVLHREDCCECSYLAVVVQDVRVQKWPDA